VLQRRVGCTSHKYSVGMSRQGCIWFSPTLPAGILRGFSQVCVCYGMLWHAMGCYGMLWDAMACSGMLWDAVGCYGMLFRPVCSYQHHAKKGAISIGRGMGPAAMGLECGGEGLGSVWYLFVTSQRRIFACCGMLWDAIATPPHTCQAGGGQLC
jgi:hypothetical protein